MFLQTRPSGRATSKQLHPFPDSRPPTSCSNAYVLNLDVGVRLNSKRKFFFSTHKLIALPLNKHYVSANKIKWEGDIEAIHPVPDSCPPTSCSTANISNFDVGVRLNDKREKGK